MGEVHSCERNVTSSEVVRWADRRMNRRLGRECQWCDPAVTEMFSVFVEEPHVAGEDDIEQLRKRKEVIEMRRIFLVPEHRGNTTAAANVQQLDYLGARSSRAGELELPGSAVAIPR